MRKWKTRWAPSCRWMSMYLPRRATLSMCWPRTSARNASGSGCFSWRGSRMVTDSITRPRSASSRYRRMISTSGNSGIELPHFASAQLRPQWTSMESGTERETTCSIASCRMACTVSSSLSLTSSTSSSWTCSRMRLLRPASLSLR